MSSSASTLRLYRNILRTAQNWPSIRRQKVIEEIRTEFRENRAEQNPERLAKLLKEAEIGLESLRAQTGFSGDGNEISYQFERR